MSARSARNASGMTLRQWIRAAGWEMVFDPSRRPSKCAAAFEALAAAWSNDVDPAEYRQCAPKSIYDLA